jgi:hypothetical protein
MSKNSVNFTVLTRHLKANKGQYLNEFLKEKGYAKDVFNKGSEAIEEKLSELKAFFKEKGYKLDRNSRVPSSNIEDSGLAIADVMKWAKDTTLSDEQLGGKIRNYQKEKERERLEKLKEQKRRKYERDVAKIDKKIKGL